MSAFSEDKIAVRPIFISKIYIHLVSHLASLKIFALPADDISSSIKYLPLDHRTFSIETHVM
jgi:hypothetical protein